MNVYRALRLARLDLDDTFDPDEFDDDPDDDDDDDEISDRGACPDCPSGQCPYDDPYYQNE
jgi:hypothetical protein